MRPGRPSMKTARLRSLTGAAGLAVALTAAVTGTASGSTTGSAPPTVPSFSKLSTNQVSARSSGRQESMVVVFDDQLTSLLANQAHQSARKAAAASMQAPLMSQLKQVGATNVTGLSLLNAVSATMPAAEAQALRQTAGVRE